MAFLCCLMKIQAIPQSDAKAVVLKVSVKWVYLLVNVFSNDCCFNQVLGVSSQASNDLSHGACW